MEENGLEIEEIHPTDSKTTTDGTIPDEIWNIFPSQGTYVKKIMKFSGYETIDSVLKLKSKDEIEKMFSFVKTMADVVEEKDAMLGIFSKCPEKVMLLPGLEVCLLMNLLYIRKKPEKIYYRAWKFVNIRFIRYFYYVFIL